MDKLGEAAVYLGKHVAASAEKRIGSKSAKAGGFAHSVLEVGGGAIVAGSRVAMGLEEAAVTLGRSIANESVLIVDHKYKSTHSLTHSLTRLV